MFAVLEKDRKQMAVHTASDLRYMLAKGWQVRGTEKTYESVEEAVAIAPVVAPKVTTKVVKRKYVRKNHAR